MLGERILPGLAASPDVHPLFVHFPIALLPVALLFWGAAIWRFSRLEPAARILVILGTAGAVIAAVTGLRAEQLMPHGPKSLVATHRLFMIPTALLAVVVTSASILTGRSASRPLRFGVLVGLGLVNAIMIPGADRGVLVALRFREEMRPRSLGATPPSAPLQPSPPDGSALTVPPGDETHGRELYRGLRCGSCHDAGAKMEAPGIPPDLSAAGSRYVREWVIEYLLHPRRLRWVDEGVRPVVRMPQFDLSREEAADLSAALAARRDTVQFPENVPGGTFTEAEVARGSDLVREYSCRGCHIVEGTGRRFGPELDGVGDRLRPAYIVAFLRDPKGVVPGTSMKDFGLWDDEMRSLTAYLMSLHGTVK
jgi:cytochrome c2/uncharacterized membrane protein